MSPNPLRPFLVLLVLLRLLTACGDPVVNSGYEGEPLVTLEGQMSVSPGTTINSSVRLALAWYPTLVSDTQSAPLSAPASIVPEEVVYESSFPVNYRFNLYRPPPKDALAPLPEGYAGKGAVGILLAYEDRNGNKRLDTIKATGEKYDDLLGASLVWTSVPAWLVIYVDTEQPAETGLKKGFNLVKMENATRSTVVPLSTPIPLKLTRERTLDALVCEASFSDPQVGDPCRLGLGGDIDPGVDAYVEGTVTLSSTGADVSLTVRRGEVYVTDALLRLGGIALQFDANHSTYRLPPSSVETLPTSGPLELRLQSPGPEQVRTLPLPGDFDFTSPAPGTHVKTGAQIDAQWTPSSGAQDYLVSLQTDTGDTVGFVTTSDTGYTFESPGYSSTFTLEAVAVARPEDGYRAGSIDVKRVRTRTFVVDP